LQPLFREGGGNATLRSNLVSKSHKDLDLVPDPSQNGGSDVDTDTWWESAPISGLRAKPLVSTSTRPSQQLVSQLRGPVPDIQALPGMHQASGMLFKNEL